jgi:hypothetical protein
MTLETAFRPPTLLPRFIQRTAALLQNGNAEGRGAHWLGNRQRTSPQQDANQGGHDDRPPQRTDPRGYRELSSLTLGEVDEAYHFYSGQLISSPAEAWIAKNYFCYLPLKDRGDTRPPAVFGRLKTCYPSDGYVDNIGQMELYFPRRAGPPDVLLLHQYDLSAQTPARSYCVGVKFYVSEEEMADFRGAENIFIEKGYAPLYENSFLDLLEVNEHNHAALPWLHVIGSGWFASIPDSMQAEVRQQLRNLVRWNTTVFNYHSRRYSLQYRNLNEELDLQYGFTEHFLIAPQDTAQVLKKVEEGFGEIFMQGIV